MAAPLERLRRALTLIPLLQRRQGMRITAIARYLGVTPREVSEEIRDLVMMCGVPPYFPHNYIGFFIEGDRVFVRFADHFRRPVRLTLPEALSLNLALRTLEGSSGRAVGPGRRGRGGGLRAGPPPGPAGGRPGAPPPRRAPPRPSSGCGVRSARSSPRTRRGASRTPSAASSPPRGPAPRRRGASRSSGRPWAAPDAAASSTSPATGA